MKPYNIICFSTAAIAYVSRKKNRCIVFITSITLNKVKDNLVYTLSRVRLSKVFIEALYTHLP